MEQYAIGDYLNQWVRCHELEGEDGERRHLMFGQVSGFSPDQGDGVAYLSHDTTIACGLQIHANELWYMDDESSKCVKCVVIAEGWQDQAKEKKPNRELVEA